MVLNRLVEVKTNRLLELRSFESDLFEFEYGALLDSNMSIQIIQVQVMQRIQKLIHTHLSPMQKYLVSLTVVT